MLSARKCRGSGSDRSSVTLTSPVSPQDNTTTPRSYNIKSIV